MSQKEKRERAAERLSKEITTENFPYLEKETDIQIQAAQNIPKKNPKRFTIGHVIIKLLNVKDR